jgi:hypothetical protein
VKQGAAETQHEAKAVVKVKSMVKYKNKTEGYRIIQKIIP